MKKKDIEKLKKALAMMQKAKALLNEVSESDTSFKYSCNASFRESRVAAAVHIVETELNERL